MESAELTRKAPAPGAPPPGLRARARASFERRIGADWKEVPPAVWIYRAGGMLALALRCLVELVTPGLSWRREFTIQCANIFAIAAFPVFLINVLVGFTGTGVQGGALLEAFGAIDRVGAIVPVALLREGSPILTGAVVAGMIGTTVTAELGARVIRQEIEALEVMGINPIRNLVLPRIAGLCAVMLILNMVGLVGGIVGAYVGAVGLLSATSGSFVTQALANTNFVDLWASELKTLVFAVMIGVIASYKGVSVKGGAEGVGRAVNQGVVSNLVGISMIGLLFTTLFLALYPDIFVLR